MPEVIALIVAGLLALVFLGSVIGRRLRLSQRQSIPWTPERELAYLQSIEREEKP
jgi:hypothetical protein